MEIAPILQTFRHNKAAVMLIMAQVAFTLAVLVNALVVIDAYTARLTMESGIPEKRIISVELDPIERGYFDDEGRATNDVLQQMQALRRIPGVESVSHVAYFPLSGEGEMRPSWPEGEIEEKAVRHTIYAGDHNFIDTFGLNLISGRGFTEEEINWSENPLREGRVASIILSAELAEQLFPGEDAIGKQIMSDGGLVDTVIGVVEKLPGRHILMNTVKLAALVPGRPSNMLRYAVLADREVTPKMLEQALVSVSRNSRIFDVRVDSLYTRKARSMHFLFLFGSILGGISLLLLLVTAIGSYSQAAYSVGKRIKQIGTRRAFGASRVQILRYFLLENWMITTAGLLLGLLLANGISFVMTQAMMLPKVSAAHLLTGMLFLWGMGLFSTFMPALRAARVPPAIATRSAA